MRPGKLILFIAAIQLHGVAIAQHRHGLITRQPEGANVPEGKSISLTIETKSDSSDNRYQWQQFTSQGWTNVRKSQNMVGVTSKTMTIRRVDGSLPGNLYRCIVRNRQIADTSISAKIRVITLRR